MKEALREFLTGMGSLLLGPAALPRPNYRITLPPENAMGAIAHDFSMVAGDFRKAIKEVEEADQLELQLK
jgi:hypothetical protein